MSPTVELLFLMVKGRDKQYADLVRHLFSKGTPADRTIVAAAEPGFPTAQFMLSMAHLRGEGVEQDNRAAYHWLRLAAVNSARVLEECRGAIEQLKSRMDSSDIQYLEQQISGETQASPTAKLKSGKPELRSGL